MKRELIKFIGGVLSFVDKKALASFSNPAHTNKLLKL